MKNPDDPPVHFVSIEITLHTETTRSTFVLLLVPWTLFSSVSLPPFHFISHTRQCQPHCPIGSFLADLTNSVDPANLYSL